MDFSIILKAIEYVTTAPMFWASMGFTTAIAMFVGAVVHNGDLPQVKKSLVCLLSYLLLLFQVTITRIINTFSDPIRSTEQIKHPEMAFAGITTIIFLTIFWGVGLFLGVWILNKKNRR